MLQPLIMERVHVVGLYKLMPYNEYGNLTVKSVVSGGERCSEER